MSVPALLGVPNSTLGGGLAMLWMFVLGHALYRNARGDYTRAQYYISVSAASFWIAFGLLQLSDALSGVAEIGLVVLSAGLLCIGAVNGVRWLNIRSTYSDG